ncbi:hypothetical protein FQN57_004045 [Myotisia sp. PD_48]|nr:hypothetical protein FQN57_004045 [Myotisia sp. PD_48]
MSRRAPAANRAAQNDQTIRNLLKLNCNKVCADCKRNKHPRWASWNIGIFVCIRCSGIHRGMGTHISRVKSVDLDTWTDEQTQSVLKWGNARANTYWEAKLNPGHVPSEAKIENFIRTKYESRRWVMDGPIPDPSTLDVEDDDDVPLAVVQEKAKLASNQPLAAPPRAPGQRQQQSVNFFDDDDTIKPPTRPKTTDISGPPRPSASNVPSSSSAAPTASKPADSLLGLDFFGPSQPSSGSRTSSKSPASTANPSSSRPDLKQSILSLYASGPKPQPQQEAFGSLSSPQSQNISNPRQDAFGGLTDAFSGLSFPSTTSPPTHRPSSISAFNSLAGPKSTPAPPKLTSPSGGGFFNDLPNKAGTYENRNASISSTGRNLDLIGVTMGSAKAPAAPPASSSNQFDLLSSPPTAKKPSPSTAMSPPSMAPIPPQPSAHSVFNLTSPKQSATTSPPAVSSNAFSPTNNFDPWGGNAWSTPEPSQPVSAPKQPSISMKIPDTLTANDIGGGWGATSQSTSKPAPVVAADEDFGGWATPTPPPPAPHKTANNTGSKPKSGGGFGGNDDIFANVWE